MASDWTDCQLSAIERAHRPDPDARVCQENLIGVLDILRAQLAFAGWDPNLAGFAQHPILAID